MENFISLALSLVALLTAGCGNALKSDYRAPQVNYPTSWQHDAHNAAPTPFDWRDFHDPELDRWLQQVMARITIWLPPYCAFTARSSRRNASASAPRPASAPH